MTFSCRIAQVNRQTKSNYKSNDFLVVVIFETADLSKTPNELLNVKRLKAKHRRLFKKLKGLNDKSLLNEFTGIEKVAR